MILEVTEKGKQREGEWRLRETDLEEALLRSEREKLGLQNKIYSVETKLHDSSLHADGIQVLIS